LKLSELLEARLYTRGPAICVDCVVSLIREFEKTCELVESLRFERGRRYVYRLASDDCEYLVHIVSHNDNLYVEFWTPRHAVPIIVLRVSEGGDIYRTAALLRVLAGRR